MKGMWKTEGRYLVVDIEQVENVNICVWSGEKVDPCEPVSFYGPATGDALEALTKVAIRLPCCEKRHQANYAKRRFMGRIVLGGSFLVSMLGLWMIWYASNHVVPMALRRRGDPMTPSVTMLLFGVIGLVLGAMWAKLKNVPGPGGYERVALIDLPHVWIADTGAEFRSSLPAWTGPPSKEVRKRLNLLAKARLKVWPMVLLNILFVVAIFCIGFLLTSP